MNHMRKGDKIEKVSNNGGGWGAIGTTGFVLSNSPLGIIRVKLEGGRKGVLASPSDWKIVCKRKKE